MEIVMRTLYLIVALNAVQFAGPALANSSDQDTRRGVAQTAGLDLSSEAGVRTLDRRILRAASSLCQSPSFADALGQKKFEKCRDKARASAAEQRLSAITRARARNAAVDIFSH
jgi:UrcA family protein